MRTPGRFWRIAATFLYVGALLYVSLTPAAAPTGSPTAMLLKRWLFNLMHIPAYALLTVLIFRIIRERSAVWLVTAGLLALVFGTMTEALQHYVPGRQPSIWDLLLNGTGVVIAVALEYRFRKPLIETPAGGES